MGIRRQIQTRDEKERNFEYNTLARVHSLHGPSDERGRIRHLPHQNGCGQSEKRTADERGTRGAVECHLKKKINTLSANRTKRQTETERRHMQSAH